LSARQPRLAKLDENVPLVLIQRLERAGFRVDTVPQEGLLGASDPDILQVVDQADGVLITCDHRWFGDLRRYSSPLRAAVVVLRAQNLGPRTALRALERALAAYDLSQLHSVLIVANTTKARLRPIP